MRKNNEIISLETLINKEYFDIEECVKITTFSRNTFTPKAEEQNSLKGGKLIKLSTKGRNKKLYHIELILSVMDAAPAYYLAQAISLEYLKDAEKELHQIKELLKDKVKLIDKLRNLISRIRTSNSPRADLLNKRKWSKVISIKPLTKDLLQGEPALNWNRETALEVASKLGSYIKKLFPESYNEVVAGIEPNDLKGHHIHSLVNIGKIITIPLTKDGQVGGELLKYPSGRLKKKTLNCQSKVDNAKIAAAITVALGPVNVFVEDYDEDDAMAYYSLKKCNDKKGDFIWTATVDCPVNDQDEMAKYFTVKSNVKAKINAIGGKLAA